MQINSINTNLAAFAAQANIRAAQTDTTTSVARLSSGNKITQASDDVAGLSIGTSLATNVSTLRTALVNAAQGVSLLSVADAALSNVTEILQRQKAIAVQAGSGTVGDTERAFLDAEFQALSAEIDRISSNTNFNGVNLINGALDAASVFTNTADQATAGSLTVNFNDIILDGESIEINGITITAEDLPANTTGLEFAVGATVAETVENLAARLNLLATDNSISGVTAADRLALSEATYSANGNSLVITSRTGGSLGSSFVVGGAGVAASAILNNEANITGDYAGVSFNLFSGTTSTFSSLTQQVSSAGAADATPFANGENLTLTIGGVSHILHTFGTDDTFEDLLNGINSNSGTTGVTAEAVYESDGDYNIRLSYNSQNGTAIIDAGNTFNSTTVKLTGDNLENNGANVDVGADSVNASQSVVSIEGYINLFDADLNAAVVSQAADITETVGNADNTEPLTQGDVITATINGTQHSLYTIAADATLADVVAGINAGTATHGIRAVVDDENGNALNVRLYLDDPAGAGITALSTGANVHASANPEATFTELGGGAATRTAEFGLSGGADDGLGIGDTIFTSSSSVGSNSILTDLSTTKANSELIFSALPTAGDSITIGSKLFYFTATASASAASNEILIGSSVAETLDNAVNVLNAYAENSAVGGEAYIFDQLNITRDGSTLSIESKTGENVLTSAGAAVTIARSNTTDVALTSANLSNAAANFGVKVNGISNSDFAGTISGFAAEYTGTADQANLSVTIGNYTYTAENVDLTVSSNTTIRFLSDTLSDGSNGGYFDIQLKAGEISSVSSQAEADAVAAQLDDAFSGLGFIQSRNISSYAAGGSFTVNGTITGSLQGTSVTAQLADFDSLNLTDVSVTAATGSATDSTVSLTIGGVTYTSANGIGTTLGANQTYRLTSSEDVNQFIEFTTGDTAISLTTADQATAFENALSAAFGANSGSAALNFQVGTNTTDTLSISIGDASTSTLYEGAALNVLTAESAATAVDALDAAIQNITSVRATVGALQSRFNFASANIESSIQNQDAARGTLLDTDIADESTAYAISQVKLQAGISVLAQANQQLQSLLKLIG